MAATAARWKSASGFDSSAEENCLNSFSRDSVEQLADRRADLVLDRAGRLGAEVALRAPW